MSFAAPAGFNFEALGRGAYCAAIFGSEGAQRRCDRSRHRFLENLCRPIADIGRSVDVAIWEIWGGRIGFK